MRQQSVPRYCDVVPEENELDYSSSGDGMLVCLVLNIVWSVKGSHSQNASYFCAASHGITFE